MTFEQIQKELVAAMKAKDTLKKSVLSEIKTAALNIAIEEKHKENITEDNVLTAMKKCQKVYQTQIDTCPADRMEWLEHFKECMKCITEYLPKQLDEMDIIEELENYLTEKYPEEEWTNPKNKGKFMKDLAPLFKGRADMKLVNKMLSEWMEIE